ncbi:hypothetical protein R70006_06310 [Paraburkholderia domus]|nr:hypothetical protein R70006_06310 [Paraburkholderia domus]
MHFMSQELAAKIDHERYPSQSTLVCEHCGGREGHYEEVWTGMASPDDDYSGWEVWFCCHACRDQNLPCETFFPIRLAPGSKSWERAEYPLAQRIALGTATPEEHEIARCADLIRASGGSPLVFSIKGCLRLLRA